MRPGMTVERTLSVVIAAVASPSWRAVVRPPLHGFPTCIPCTAMPGVVDTQDCSACTTNASPQPEILRRRVAWTRPGSPARSQRLAFDPVDLRNVKHAPVQRKNPSRGARMQHRGEPGSNHYHRMTCGCFRRLAESCFAFATPRPPCDAVPNWFGANQAVQ